jgi:hypothetical protein
VAAQKIEWLKKSEISETLEVFGGHSTTTWTLTLFLLANKA